MLLVMDAPAIFDQTPSVSESRYCSWYVSGHTDGMVMTTLVSVNWIALI